MTLQLRDSSSFSSVPSSTCSYKYDVFLCFRGQDTRHGFTGHLYNTLVQRGFDTFMDENDLPRGEEIFGALFRVIEESKLSLIVFSENFASSKYCLDELVHILDCRRSKNQIVVPIFYKVYPSDVVHQKGTYRQAFAEHESIFEDDRVLRWRAALNEAARLYGLDISGDGHEWKFIERIVQEVSALVKKPTYIGMPEYLVGIHTRVLDMLKLLDIGGSDVRMVGIWGMGGVGKTTIAKAVYNTIAHKFDGCCFLADVREVAKQHGGLVTLQNTILSQILVDKELEVTNVDIGIQVLRQRLSRRKIFLVVDDVDDLHQLNKLAGGTDWFGHSSRIIITTRDKHLLTVHKNNTIYEARELDYDEGFELLSSITFKNKKILDDDEMFLISNLVRYTEGLPLALVVFGSYLCDRPVTQWQAIVDGYKIMLPPKLFNILSVSFDGLEETEKVVFLDIACFFKGWNRNDVIQILEGCGRINPEHSIEVLIENGLINVCGHGHICMRDLLEEMAKNIVERESKEPGERSRLWHHKDVDDVLTGDTGSRKIEGILVNMPTTDEIHLSPKCLKKMKNLKILIIVNAWFAAEIINLPNLLRLLDWTNCPLPSIPSNFNTKKIIKLSMPGSCISHLGEGFKGMINLKSLILKGSKLLTHIPDLSGSPNLEFLDLSWCTSLVEIHASVGSLEKLVHLNLHNCSNLLRLPEKVNWISLQTIDIEFCTRLESFPQIMGGVKNMTSLRIEHTGIKALPSSIRDLIDADKLKLRHSGNVTNIPCRICKLQNLEKVYSLECPELTQTFANKVDSELLPIYSKVPVDSLHVQLPGSPISFPEDGFKMECLKLLDLSGTVIKELPSSVKHLSSLQELVLKECENLINLPSDIYKLQHLWRLDFQDCSNLDKFPEWIDSKTSHNLWYLNLCGCKRLEEIPELPPTVEWINVADCLQLRSFVKLSNILEHKESEMIKCITMFNCQRLCDSLAREMAEKRNIFLNEVTLCSLFLSCMQFEFDIVFPGSEIPKWFSCRKDSMELTGKCEFPFEIASNINSANKGFAICAAAATVENFDPDGEDIMQECSFTATIEINGDRIVTRSFYFEVEYIELAHVWLCYIPFDRFVSHKLPAFKCGISLEHSCQGSLRIKSFGVHLVLAQDEGEDEDKDEDEDEDSCSKD